MGDLTSVILPVFLVIGFGYVAVWRGYFSESGVDGLMKFTQNFAIPCLLFRAIAGLDLGNSFDFTLLFSFYTGALAGFVLGFFGARLLFGRNLEDATAIGFCCLFSNSVLLGLPITERAYGVDALVANYAIVAVHSLFCYAVGITVMEVVRARGKPLRHVPGTVLRAMFSNALIIGIVSGFAVNLAGLTLPVIVGDALDMMVSAALPAALFGLGGVLVRYRPEGDLRTIFYVCAVSLLAHPTIVYGMAHLFDLPRASLRSAVITAAMAPGINTYIFANMYGAARRVAASAVLLGTGLSVLSVWFWLWVLA